MLHRVLKETPQCNGSSSSSLARVHTQQVRICFIDTIHPGRMLNVKEKMNTTISIPSSVHGKQCIQWKRGGGAASNCKEIDTALKHL